MKLLLDIGNTRIKWAWQADSGLENPGECVHRGVTAEAACAALGNFSQPPTAAVALNVAGAELEIAVAERLSDAYGVILHRVQTGAEWGAVKNGYSDYGQLGADRWAAIVGAWEQGDDDVVVVDAGTAVTIDLLRADGQHLGGVILAGLRLSEVALGGETADIADFAARQPGPGDADWYGRSTVEAVRRGAAFSLCAAIDRAVKRFPRGAADADRPPRLLLTGGDAEMLLPGLRTPAELRPQLVLEGLAKLAGGN